MLSRLSRFALILGIAWHLMACQAFGQQLTVLKPEARVDCMAFSPNGQYLATGIGKAGERIVVVWELTTGKEIKRLEGHANFVTKLWWRDNTTLMAFCTALSV